jgi:hypothetical protein
MRKPGSKQHADSNSKAKVKGSLKKSDPNDPSLALELSQRGRNFQLKRVGKPRALWLLRPGDKAN